MAGVRGTLSTAVQAVTSTPKTILMMKPVNNHRALLESWGVDFDGTSGTDKPVQVELIRCSTAVTGSAINAVKINPDDAETLQTSGVSAFTTEPAVTEVIYQKRIHPQGGWQETFPYGQEIPCQDTKFLAIRVTATNNVNATPLMKFVE